jgi:DNA-directed RNA polymerase subunit RPC12/RpoP
MAIRAGETAKEAKDYLCVRCRSSVHVARGQQVPKCPNCGGTAYNER